jgi:hypothetical protein
VYSTGAKGIDVQVEQGCSDQVLNSSHAFAFNLYNPGDKYIALLNVGEELEKGFGETGDGLLHIRKTCLVGSGCPLEREDLIEGSHIILSKSIDLRGLPLVVSVSKKALLTLQPHRQLNSEVIDAVMYLTAAEVMQDSSSCPDVRYVCATLLPSEASGVLVCRNWKWLKPYLRGGHQYLFLLHEEYIASTAGHYSFLLVELPRREVATGAIHVFDPNLHTELSAKDRLLDLSHLPEWVSKFFCMYGVTERECAFEMKIALPMPRTDSIGVPHKPIGRGRVSSLARLRHIRSPFSMRTQEDGVSCGVVCAQMMEYILRHKTPPLGLECVPFPSVTYRDRILTKLCDNLKVVIPPFDEHVML